MAQYNTPSPAPLWARENDFFVDNFHRGLRVFRLETTRSDVITDIEHHYKEARSMFQGHHDGKNSYLLLLPLEVLFNDLDEIVHSINHAHYLREDHHTRTIWEWEERVGR